MTTTPERAEAQDEMRLCALEIAHEERERDELAKLVSVARAQFEGRVERAYRSLRARHARAALRDFEQRLDATRLRAELAKRKLYTLERTAEAWDESVDLCDPAPWRETVAERAGVWLRPHVGEERIAVEPDPDLVDPDLRPEPFYAGPSSRPHRP
jgi:hypothetical protein